MSWTAGYITDIEYSPGFFSELSPAYLSAACAINGFESCRIDRPYTYCELGFGRGVTINVLAATNPNGEFYGVDFNPEHVVSARKLADAACLSNVRLLEESFESLVDGKVRDLPQFDFIVLHGIYTWVSEENRRHLRRFVRDFLKPGGIVYVSYNAMPGWASGAPLQGLVREIASLRPARSDKRLDEARTFVKRLIDLQAPYFTVNASTDVRVQSLMSGDPRYLIHEYLNDDFGPLYHADVARQFLDDSKLQFAGSADLSLAFPSLYLTQERRDLLATIHDAAVAETVKDFLLNTAFRKDVFVRGARALSTQGFTDAMARLGIALCVPRDQVNLEMQLTFGKITAREEMLNPILDALASRPHGFAELAALPAMKDKTLRQISQAASLLIATSQAAIYPMPPPTRTASKAHALNRVLADAMRHGDEFHVLASPLLGSGVSVTSAGLLAHRLLAEAGAS